jgi:hypothetical protein
MHIAQLLNPTATQVIAAFRSTSFLEIRGALIFDQAIDLSGMSGVVMDMSRVTQAYTSMVPLLADVDTGATNNLIRASCVRGSTPFAFLAANCSESGDRITLAGAAGAALATAISTQLARGQAFIELVGKLGINNNIDPNRATTDILPVASVAGTTIILAAPLKHSRQYNEATDPTRVYLLDSVPQNITIVGGTFDCTGKYQATGIYLKGARNVELLEQKARGFARSFIELQHGTEGVKVDYKSLGGNGCNILVEAAHHVSMTTDYDPDGDWLNPYGTPRSWYQQSKSPCYIRGNMRIGKHAQGMTLWGGRHCEFTIVGENLDAGKFTGRTRGDEAGQSDRGVLVTTGAADTGGDWVEFCDDLHLPSITGVNIKTPNATNQPAVYLHDVYGLHAGHINLTNRRESPTGDYDGTVGADAFNGVVVSDAGKAVKIDTLIVRGFSGFAYRSENGDGLGKTEIGHFIADTGLSSGAGSGKGIQIASGGGGVGYNLRLRIERFDLENTESWEIEGSADPNYALTVERYRSGNLFNYHLGPAVLAKRSAGSNPTLGCLLEPDSATPFTERRVKNSALTAGISGKYIFLHSVSSSGSDVIVVMPTSHGGDVLGIALVRAADAIVFGDRIVHDGTTGKWKKDNAATSEFKIATQPKDAGSEATVYFRNP